MEPKKLKHTPIAIIGHAGIFPQAHNSQEYWDNIVQKIDSITDVPPSRWNVDDYYDPDPHAPDKTYCKRGGFIPDIDFNPMEFGLPPNILEVTDVSQLLALVVARDLMNNAGYGPERHFNRDNIGVIFGAVGGQKLITPLASRLQSPVWRQVLLSSGIPEQETEAIIAKMKLAYVPWNKDSFPGLLSNVIAGRVANRLDLGGTNCTVDAACASSLSALRMAVSELTAGRADMMITGGVDMDNSPFMYLCFSKTPALSPSQMTRPFDVALDGMMVGEGVGMVLLKRLADAERDGDQIYAIIKGIGTSSDGKFKSIYAPRPAGQAQALRRAYADAGCAPTSVGLIEAHGTGTRAGDPAEFEGLKMVFESDARGQHIALGSVKSQIGHTKAAAGAAGLIKAALALHHKVLPPTINVTRPHPALEIEKTPFYINTEARPWIRANGTPRRAGVSAFGFGGTNFHIVLEEHTSDHTTAYRTHHVAHPILLYAETPGHLLALCEQTLHAITADEAAYHQVTARSRDVNIPLNTARVGFVADNREQAAQWLQTAITTLKRQPDATAWEHPRGIFYRQQGVASAGKVVALFPGQGSQYLNMGRELAMNFPPLRQAYEQMDALFIQDEMRPLSAVVFPIPAFDEAQEKAQFDALRQTAYAQAAIGVFSAGMLNILRQAGFAPDFAAGHSFGELSALWAGGMLSNAGFFKLVKARGKAMMPPPHIQGDTGGMLAVKGDLTNIEADVRALDGIIIANINSNSQVVLAGPTVAIQHALNSLQAQGYTATLLPVSAAFHTSLVGHASEPFTQAVNQVDFQKAHIPIYSNTTGRPYPTEEQSAKDVLAQHILRPVIFKTQIENIYDAGGTIFVEIGPRRVVTNLISDILADKPHVTVALNSSRQKSSDRQFREAVVQLKIVGLPLGNIDPYATLRVRPFLT